MGNGLLVGKSHEGNPVYLCNDPHSKKLTYIVHLPDGRAFYSDKEGKIVATPVDTDKQVAGAALGAIAGLAIGGPAGGIVGAIVGAIVGNAVAKSGGE